MNIDFSEALERNKDFNEINMFVDMIRRQIENQKGDDDWQAEDEHLKVERELRKALLMTEGVPLIKIVDIVCRNGYNIQFDS